MLVVMHLISILWHVNDNLLRSSDSPALLTPPQLLCGHPALNNGLQLRPEVSDVKSLLVNDRWLCMRRVTTVPLQRVYVRRAVKTYCSVQ